MFEQNYIWKQQSHSEKEKAPGWDQSDEVFNKHSQEPCSLLTLWKILLVYDCCVAQFGRLFKQPWFYLISQNWNNNNNNMYLYISVASNTGKHHPRISSSLQKCFSTSMLRHTKGPEITSGMMWEVIQFHTISLKIVFHCKLTHSKLFIGDRGSGWGKGLGHSHPASPSDS